MKLLLDENIPRLVLIPLRDQGHDVLHIADEAASIADPHVLALATRLQRAVITSDLDLAELVVRHRHRVPGLLTLRGFAHLPPDDFAALFTRVWHAAESRLWGHLITATGDRLRYRPLLT